MRHSVFLVWCVALTLIGWTSAPAWAADTRLGGHARPLLRVARQGTVVAVHSGGLYRVQCDAGHEVLAQLSGRMRRFRIKVVPGDRVTVGVSPYDPVRGIITFRAR